VLGGSAEPVALRRTSLTLGSGGSRRVINAWELRPGLDHQGPLALSLDYGDGRRQDSASLGLMVSNLPDAPRRVPGQEDQLRLSLETGPRGPDDLKVINLRNLAVDPDGTNLSFSLAEGSTPPAGVSFNAAAAELRLGSLPFEAVGRHTFTLLASEGNAATAVPLNFEITIRERNLAPLWNLPQTLLFSQAPPTGWDLISQRWVLDANGDPLRFSLSSGDARPLAAGIRLDGTRLVVDPATLAGTYALRLGASDGPERPLVQALTNLVVPAPAVAVPPTLRVEGSLRLAEGTAFGLQLRLDRPAAAELTLRWTLNPRRDSAESLLPSRTGLVRIAAGAEGALLSLPSRDDGLLLGDQELELVLESLSGAVQLPAAPTTLTLLENDSSPLLLTSRWLNGRELELTYQPGPLASQGPGLMVRLSDPLLGELLENASVVSVFRDGWMGESREDGSLQLSWSDPLAAGWPGTATVSLARLRFAGVDAASSPAIRIEASAGEDQLVRWNNIAWQAPTQPPFLEELRARLGGSFAGVQFEPSLAGAFAVSAAGDGRILDPRILLERRYGLEPTLSLQRNGETIQLDLSGLIPGDRGLLQLSGTDWALLPAEAHESSPQEQAHQAMLIRSPGGDSNLNNLSLLSLSTAARRAIQQQAAGRDPLFGQLSFQLSGIAPGSLQKVEVILPGEGLLDPVLLKQDKTGAWHSFDYDPITGTGAIFHDDDNNGSKERAVLWIRDGGRGDNDGLTNGIILDPAVFAGTLPAPILRVTGDQVQRNEGNTGSTLFSFTVSRTGDLDRQSSAVWSISGSGASPATATDFSAAVLSSGSVQFVAGESQKTITVEVIGDTNPESDEEFTLSLSDSIGASIDPAASSATALIKNDDLPSITLVAAPGLVSEDEPNNIIYTFTRTGPTTTSLSVSFTVGGTATLGTDYTGIVPTSATKTVSFAAGSSTATVTVDPTADVEIEPDETVALTLAAGSGYSIGTSAAVVGTILNDDFPSTVTLALSPASVTEDGSTNLVYTFSRTGPTTGALTVNYTIAGTADSSDYTGATPGTGKTIAFAAGSATATLTIDPTADDTVESNDTVALSLASGSGYTIGTTTAVIGTINDLLLAPTIDTITGDDNLSVSDYEVGITITGSGNPGATVTIQFEDAFFSPSDDVISPAYNVVVNNYGQWSLNLAPAQVGLLGVGDDMVIAYQSWPGSDGVSETAYRLFTIESAPAPTIDVIGGDDVITTAEAIAGFTIQGTGVPGASILLAFSSGYGVEAGAIATVDAAGIWSLSISPQDVVGFAEGVETIEVSQQLLGTGFSSGVTSHSFVIEAAPLPTVDAIATDNIISPEEAQLGFSISGSGLPGATIIVLFASGVTPELGSSVDVNQAERWSFFVSPSDIARIGPISESIEVYQVITQLGLTSPAVPHDFLIEDAPVPSIDVITGDDSISASDLRSGFVISGRGMPGSTIHLEFDSGTLLQSGSTALVAADGTWSVSVVQTDVIGFDLGQETILVRQTIPVVGFTSRAVSNNFTVEVINLPPSAVALNNAVTSLAENSSTLAAIKVADIVISDDVLGSNIISLEGADAAIFEVVGTGLFLKAGTSLNYETKVSYSLTVSVSDPTVAGSLPVTTSYALAITDVNEAPTAVMLNNSITSLEENTATLAAIKVADIAITDDALGSNTVSLAGADAASFEVVGNALFLKAGTSLNYEAKPSYGVSVSVSDFTVAGSVPVTTSYALAVRDLNEAPTALNLSATAFDENIPAGSQIALLSTADPDSTPQSFTYSLVSGTGSTHNLFFSLAGNALRITRSPDYETRSTYSIRLRTTDQGGLFNERSVVLNVNDLPDSPTYSFSKSADVVYERGALSIGVSTTNVAAGKLLYWSLSGTSITAGDFSDGNLLGSVSLGNDGKASFSKVVAADGLIEVDESLDVKFFNDAARSQQIGTTLSITLKEPVVGVVSDGPDIITGTSANDVITGVPTGSSLRGRGTVDRLTGGGGNDQFLLADRTGAYYNDGDASKDGSADIAVITDFNVGDSIRLFGSASLYQLSQGVYGGSAGLWIRILPTGSSGVAERIGFVQSAALSSLNLNSASQFTYWN
jgi:hypothetical protein